MAAQPSSPFQGVVAFTGRLASMKREEAFALVREQGCTPRRGLTRNTSVLVVGQLGWPLLAAFGLLDRRGDCYGFRDLAAARQLAELLRSGVALSTITRSLHEIRKWL